MKLVSQQEILDRYIGKRETFENKLKADYLSQKIKNLSKKEHLTEKELTEKISEYTKEALEM